MAVHHLTSRPLRQCFYTSFSSSSHRRHRVETKVSFRLRTIFSQLYLIPSCHSSYLCCSLMLSSHLCLSLPSCLLPSFSPPKPRILFSKPHKLHTFSPSHAPLCDHANKSWRVTLTCLVLVCRLKNWKLKVR